MVRLPSYEARGFRVSRIRIDTMYDRATRTVDLRVQLRAGHLSGDGETDVYNAERMCVTAASDPRYLDHAVKRAVMRALEHEVDEWLRRDGKLINDPHPLAPGSAYDGSVVTVVDEGMGTFKTADGRVHGLALMQRGDAW